MGISDDYSEVEAGKLVILAFGLSIVTCPVVGIRDFFEDSPMGYTIDTSDPGDYTELMARLVRSRELCATMWPVQAGIRPAAIFSFDGGGASADCLCAGHQFVAWRGSNQRRSVTVRRWSASAAKSSPLMRACRYVSWKFSGQCSL